MGDFREKCKRTGEIDTSNVCIYLFIDSNCHISAFNNFFDLSIFIILPQKVTVFTKEASKRWRALEGDDKKPWEERAALDRKRYEEEMEHYVPPPGMGGKSRKKVTE